MSGGLGTRDHEESQPEPGEMLGMPTRKNKKGLVFQAIRRGPGYQAIHPARTILGGTVAMRGLNGRWERTRQAVKGPCPPNEKS